MIDINHGARSLPFLNNEQSGTAHIPDFHFSFQVTADNGAPLLTLDWPDQADVAPLSTQVTLTTLVMLCRHLVYPL